MNRILRFSLTLFCLSISFFAFGINLTEGQTILSTIDIIMTLEETDFSALMTIISEDPGKGVKKQVIQQYRRDNERKFLLIFREPVTQRGQAYLNIDTVLQIYDPESGKFQPTSLKEQFAGSDINNSDFGESTLANDYQVTAISEEKLGKYDVYKMNLKGRNEEVTYPQKTIWVTVSNHLLLKIEDYSTNGRLMRTLFYPSYVKAGTHFLPNRMIFVDNLIQGRKTEMTLTNISIKKLDNHIFTKAFIDSESN